MQRSRLLPHAAALTLLALSTAGPAAASPAVKAAPHSISRVTASLTQRPANPTASTSATFAFTTSGATATTCSLDGATYVPCSSPVAYSGLRSGAHSFTVRASGKAGAATASYGWTVTATATVSPLGVPGNWTVKFDDEFSGTSLDLTKWQPNWLASTNTAITPPDNSNDLNCMDPAQVTEGSGVLNLTAVARSCRASNNTTYGYASGLVNTYRSFSFTYGYVEARVYVPATAGGVPVNFPAVWADGKGTWPTTGELDVMEVLGDCGPGVGFHFHSSLGAFGGCAHLAVSSGWHTFGANWQSGVVTYYYDGQPVGQVSKGVTGAPMYLIVNNSVDPTWGGPTQVPAALQVDYVRVWQ